MVVLGGYACASGETQQQEHDGASSVSASSASAGGSSACPMDCSFTTPACQVAQCNEATGNCEVVPDDDGTPCDDGVFCTLDDACSAGECVGGPPNDCALEPTACETVTCHEETQTCDTQPSGDGSPCVDDANLCLLNPTCSNGQCLGPENDCFLEPVPDDCHVSKCDPGDGLCKPEPGNAGQPCLDPNDLCTVAKTCDTMGTCQGGMPKDCSSLSQGCFVGVCDATSGQCTTQSVMNGAPCNDLDSCTSGETCQNGSCLGGTAITACIANDGCCPSTCNTTNDSDCALLTYGYAVEFSQASGHSPDFLLGSAIVVPQAIVLTHLSLISKQNGPSVKIGLYSDAGGHPNQLLVQVPSSVVTTGVNEFPVTNINLAAGTYWFMAVFSANASIGIDFNNNDPVDYMSLSFSSSLPSVFPFPTTYTGQRFNYYLKGHP